MKKLTCQVIFFHNPFPFYFVPSIGGGVTKKTLKLGQFSEGVDIFEIVKTPTQTQFNMTQPNKGWVLHENDFAHPLHNGPNWRVM